MPGRMRAFTLSRCTGSRLGFAAKLLCATSWGREEPSHCSLLYYRQKIVPLVSLTAEVWYQQSLRTANDYRWHVESGFEFRLAKAIALKTMAIWHFESAVPLGVKRYDVLWTVGATAEWSSLMEENKL